MLVPSEWPSVLVWGPWDQIAHPVLVTGWPESSPRRGAWHLQP